MNHHPHAERRQLHDGRKDGLEALEPLDPDRVKGFAGLLEAMSKTAFGGRRLGEAFEVLKIMIRDPDCHVVLTVSGAMTVAKMGMLMTRMIDTGMVHTLVCTGALMAHGLNEAAGLVHYKHDGSMRQDEELFQKGYNRIYDTLEMEKNLNHLEQLIHTVMDRMPTERPWGSADFCLQIGRHLAERERPMPGILHSAYRNNVPVFIPAFTDSELCLDVSTWMAHKVMQGHPHACSLEDVLRVVPGLNPSVDLNQYAERIAKAKRVGIFSIGGGVPRNWAQQVAPYLDILAIRLGMDLPVIRFQYGVRICPEPVHWGGLSGCTYSEGVSWGKFVPVSEGGRYAEVYCDATIAWPILIVALLEDLELH